MGLDVMYSKLSSATSSVSPTLGALALSPNIGPAPPNTMQQTDPDNWSVRFRVHRDFYP
jgi:hypothetical protein